MAHAARARALRPWPADALAGTARSHRGRLADRPLVSPRSGPGACTTSRCASEDLGGRAGAPAGLAACADGLRCPGHGAEGAIVAFIHPAAAHGVLVELERSRRAPRFRGVSTTGLRPRHFTYSSPRIGHLTDLAARRAVSASTAARCSASCRARCGRRTTAARCAQPRCSWRCGRCWFAARRPC